MSDDPAATSSTATTTAPVATGSNVDDLVRGKHCDDCLSGTEHPGEPQGAMGDLGGMAFYLAKGIGADRSKVVVIATDAFGLGISNPKLIADRLATSTGFDVYVPDLTQGDYPPMDKMTLIEKPIAHKPFFERLSLKTVWVWGFLRHTGVTFFWRHRPAVVVPLAQEFFTRLRTERAVEHVGLVGYCLGGQFATKLAALPAPSSSHINVAVVAHPGPLSVADFKGVQVPFALICAQEDFSFDGIKADALKALDGVREQKGLPVEVYEHPETTHGFAARADLTDPVAKKAYEEALQQTSEWLKKHL